MRESPPVIVGRGRMGSAFASAWRDAHVPFVTLPGRRPVESARMRAPRRTGRTLWVLAVTDAAVASVCSNLTNRGWIARGDGVVHLAGILGPEVLASARDVGALVGSMHPLVAVADPRRPPSLHGSAASFEGDARLAAWLRRALKPTGLSIHRLTGVDRAPYHAAAALCATGAIALAQGAAALFPRAAKSGSSEAAVRAFVRSLLASAAHNVFVAGPQDALASPLLRGDAAAIARHLRSMGVAPRARTLYAAALLQVIDSLRERGRVPPEVLDAAAQSAEIALRRFRRS